MLRICCLIYLVFVIGFWCESEFLQERAKLKYSNPKYIKDVVVFTARKSRHDPYLTNMSGTILMPYGNNVSLRIRYKEVVRKECSQCKGIFYIDSYGQFKGITKNLLNRGSRYIELRISLAMATGGDFKIASKLCDSFKNKWMNEYVQSFTNVSLRKCPIPPARYLYKNMELPPKNIPVPITDGDYTISFELYVTATKEPILDARTLLRFDNKKTAKKVKKG